MLGLGLSVDMGNHVRMHAKQQKFKLRKSQKLSCKTNGLELAWKELHEIVKAF